MLFPNGNTALSSSARQMTPGFSFFKRSVDFAAHHFDSARAAQVPTDASEPYVMPFTVLVDALLASVSDTIVPTNTLSVALDLKRTIVDLIPIGQIVARDLQLTVLSDAIATLTDRVAQVFSPTATVETIVPTDSGTGVMTKNVRDTITASDELTPNLVLPRTFVDTVLMSDALAVVLAQVRSIVDTLTVNQLAAKSTAVNISDVLTMVDLVRRIKEGAVIDTFAPADVLIAERITAILQPLTVSQTVASALTLTLAVVHAIVAAHGVQAFNATSENCNTAYVTLSSRDTVVLTHPYVTPTRTVTLRNPEFGNRFSLDLNTVTKRTMSGELKQVKASSWPVIETFRVSFTALSKALADSVLDFMEASAGDEVGYLDHEGRQWRGVIVTPVTEVAHDIRDCGYSVSFDFLGVLA